ncbi:hypothetical protein BASA81_002366 [Batrachochytrium salamandrivorans]|nr:hypothetical protein BASA81_002366 [Batrachochytrium salamandrivorans]
MLRIGLVLSLAGLGSGLAIEPVSDYLVALAGIPFELPFAVRFKQEDVLGHSLVFASLYEVGGPNGPALLTSFNQSIWHPTTLELVDRITFGSIVFPNTGKQTVVAEVYLDPQSNSSSIQDVWVISGFTTLLPLFFIMFIAIAFQSVLPALFCGVWFAAFLLYENKLWVSFARTWDTIILGALMDRGNQMVILFVMTTAGFIEMINESRGSVGLANALSVLAKSPRSSQTVALLFGCVLFFDDYASALIVGGTMGPVTDRCLVSREKLAFIVDSGAAPIAALIPITSWTAFESSLLQTEANKLLERGVPFAELGFEVSGFLGLLKMLQFAYYSIFLLFFQMVVIITGKEFGPMFSAERRARMREFASPQQHPAPSPLPLEEGEHEQEEFTATSLRPPKCRNGFLPIAFFIALVLVLLLALGAAAVPETEEVAIDNIFTHVDSISVMLYAATISCMVVALFYRMQCISPLPSSKRFNPNGETGENQGDIGQQQEAPRCYNRTPLMSLSQSLSSFTTGFAHLTPTVMILVLAWGMGSAIDALGAGRYFASALQGSIAPQSLPSLIYCISSIVSYSTGSSWGSMALMYPICGPVAFQLSQLALASARVDIYYCSMAAILEGSVFGAHCSFICDTTIMSSMACECAIAQHVKTQVPYSIFNALLSLVVGFALVGVVPIGFTYLLGFALILVGVNVLGARPGQPGKLDRVSALYCWFQQRIMKRPAHDIEIMQLMHQHERDSQVSLPSFVPPPFQQQQGDLGGIAI